MGDNAALLKFLSVNGRATIQELAQKFGMKPEEVSKDLEELSSREGLTFAPEINFENLWLMEFAKQARQQTKRSIIGEASEIVANAGFSEYLLKLDFESMPKYEELANATSTKERYVQFLATTKSKKAYGYVLARTYDDISYIVRGIQSKLSKYQFTLSVIRIFPEWGFFPIDTDMINSFKLFDSYKNLLAGLTKRGRAPFSEIGAEYGQGSTQMLYAYDRLIRTRVLKWVTYYIANISQYSIAFLELTLKGSGFEKEKEKWYLKMVKSEVCPYVYMAHMLSPLGYFGILAFQDKDELEKEINALSKFKYAESKVEMLDKILVGKIGLRYFDMRYSSAYAYLESKGLVERQSLPSPGAGYI
jgi:DNA-binding Lrp family transcriptional regulator